MTEAVNAKQPTVGGTSDACPPTYPSPFCMFRMTVGAICDITPSIRRFTFRGEDVEHFADPGLDQRIKIILPAGGRPISAQKHAHQAAATRWTWASFLEGSDDWYGMWRAMDPDTRPVIRTYTTRAVRYEAAEVDVDMVVHPPFSVVGEEASDRELGERVAAELFPAALGPAARWIRQAQVGDEAVILGPNRHFVGECGGQDFIAPAVTEAFLIAGDETAAPAIARILEELPASAKGVAVVELPSAADCVYLPTHPGIELRVFARGDRPHGDLLITEVMRAASELSPPGVAHEVEEIDVDHELLWEVPRHAKGGAALKRASLYTWLAGEAGAVKTLRRHLVAERGMDRRSVAFMGYWRLGRAEC